MAGENNNFGNFRFPATPQFTPPPTQFDPFYAGVPNNMQGPAIRNTGAFNYIPDTSNVSSSPRLSEDTTESQDESREAKKQRWSNDQTAVLVEEWKSRIKKVESSQSNEAWHGNLEEVNKVGLKKTVKQCKDKINNLKQSYKEAKAKNKETGESPKRSPFYDELDEVLGTRAVTTMPGIIQVGQSSNDCTRDTSTPGSTASTSTDLSQETKSDCESIFKEIKEIKGKGKDKGKGKSKENKGGKRKRAEEDNTDFDESDEMNGKGNRGKEGGKRKRGKDDKNSFIDLTEVL